MEYDPWTPELRTAHKHETERIIDKFKKAFYKSEPEIVYHYSQIENLQSILKTNVFWASNIKNLNDPSEYKYGINLVTGLIYEERETGRYDRLFIDLLLIEINKYKDFADNLFIVSFSLNGDSLPLWQSYSDADLMGYNLGFYYKNFDFSYKYCHGNVIYSIDEQKRILFELVDEFESYYRKIGEMINASSFRDFVNRWHWEELISYFTLFKHRDFSYEEEYRVVYYITPCNEYHINGRDSDKPYIEIPTVCHAEDRYDLPLCEITLGPKNITSDNEVRSIFQVEKFGDIEIKRSNTAKIILVK